VTQKRMKVFWVFFSKENGSSFFGKKEAKKLYPFSRSGF